MNSTVYGLDIAKQVFQVHSVDIETGEIQRKRLLRADVLSFFVNAPQGVVALESCGSAHYWGREIGRLGHTVRLIHPRFVRPFVKTNKNDAADAEAIWEAAQRPGMRFCALKDETTQAVASLHRMRSSLVKFRTMQLNQVRGILGEFGLILPQGREAALKAIRASLDWERVPRLLHESLKEQLQRVYALDEQIARIERELKAWMSGRPSCVGLTDIPGVGLITATAAVAILGDGRHFSSGRQFAAFIGLVPRHRGTGGKTRLGHISKRGDRYLRTLLIHGARAALRRSAIADPWVKNLLARRPFNVVAVALANKMARRIWAMITHGRAYAGDYAVASA